MFPKYNVFSSSTNRSSHSIRAHFHLVGLLLQPDDDSSNTTNDDSSNTTNDDSANTMGSSDTTTTLRIVFECDGRWRFEFLNDRCWWQCSLKKMKEGGAELSSSAPTTSTGNRQRCSGFTRRESSSQPLTIDAFRSYYVVGRQLSSQCLATAMACSPLFFRCKHDTLSLLSSMFLSPHLRSPNGEWLLILLDEHWLGTWDTESPKFISSMVACRSPVRSIMMIIASASDFSHPSTCCLNRGIRISEYSERIRYEWFNLHVSSLLRLQTLKRSGRRLKILNPGCRCLNLRLPYTLLRGLNRMGRLSLLSWNFPWFNLRLLNLVSCRSRDGWFIYGRLPLA